MDEEGRIQLVLATARAAGAALSSEGVVLGPGDDAALLRCPPSHELVWSTDDQVEDTHFRRSWSSWAGYACFGTKAAGASLSDLAAMGAEPLGALLSLRVPPGLPLESLAQIARGVGEGLAAARCPLVGGNLAQDPAGLGLTLNVLGHAPAGRAWRRTGARAKDHLFVSGTLGLARLGLTYLEQGGDPGDPAWEEPLAALLRPRPRLELSRRLQSGALGPSAALDLSDGLARDLPRLALASGLCAELRGADLPSPPAELCAQVGLDPQRCALLGGEDYELLLAGPAELAGDGLVDVGTLREGAAGEVLVDRKPLDIKGFDHFS